MVVHGGIEGEWGCSCSGYIPKNVQDQITVGTDFYFIYFVLRGVGTEGHISDLGGYHFFM